MPMAVVKKRNSWLPKFDSTPWLSLGVVCSLFLLADSIWALIIGWHDPFFPYQILKLFGIGFGIALGVHSADLIFYYRRHGPLKRD
jgi:hypothetical protein